MPDAAVNGRTIHYELRGEGTPLILLHGIGSSSRSWSRQLHGLSADFKVIAWDAPGYGGSSDPVGRPAMRYYADCLRGLVDALGIHGFFLLGHSTGGVIAQEFYRRNSQYVRKLILADTRFVGSKATLDDRLRAIRTTTPAEMAKQRAPKLLSRSAPRDLVDEVTEIMSAVRPAGYEFAAIALAECDTRDVLNSLHVPTLLIWGSEDEITPVWNELPMGARCEIISGAGHLCYIEQPDKFNGIVREFLREDHSS
ncbi:MAG TPA: alpha/beta fold hydrolase [Terriglobia bacterium]|nr:alpha/beta fold hydrolase [Terriglobia bacterium]